MNTPSLQCKIKSATKAICVFRKKIEPRLALIDIETWIIQRENISFYLEGKRHEIIRRICLHLLNLLQNPLHRRVLPVKPLIRHVIADDLILENSNPPLKSKRSNRNVNNTILGINKSSSGKVNKYRSQILQMFATSLSFKIGYLATVGWLSFPTLTKEDYKDGHSSQRGIFFYCFWFLQG